MSRKESRLRRLAREERDNAIDALEEGFLAKEISEGEARYKLTQLFGNDDHYWILYDMRKHDIPYGK